MRFKKYLSALTSVLVLGIGGLQGAAAQSFPTRPIQLVIPFQPGDTDSMLRPFAEKMGEFLGQPVVLSYKPGAGGGVGAAFVAASKPDGYTLVGSSPGSLVVVPLANKEFSIHHRIVRAGRGARRRRLAARGGIDFALEVGPGNWSTHAKREPGKGHLRQLRRARHHAPACRNFLPRTPKIELNHIPFQGSGPAITALLGGHIDMASTAIAAGPGAHQGRHLAGRSRPSAMRGSRRFPDVPTLKEAGFDVGSPTLYGIAAPQGTPTEVVDVLYAAAKKATDAYNSQIAANLALLGAQIGLLGPKEYSDYLAEQKRFVLSGDQDARLKATLAAWSGLAQLSKQAPRCSSAAVGSDVCHHIPYGAVIDCGVAVDQLISKCDDARYIRHARCQRGIDLAQTAQALHRQSRAIVLTAACTSGLSEYPVPSIPSTKV